MTLTYTNRVDRCVANVGPISSQRRCWLSPSVIKPTEFKTDLLLSSPVDRHGAACVTSPGFPAWWVPRGPFHLHQTPSLGCGFGAGWLPRTARGIGLHPSCQPGLHVLTQDLPVPTIPYLEHEQAHQPDGVVDARSNCEFVLAMFTCFMATSLRHTG